MLPYEGMRHAFVFQGVAVLVGPWREPMDPPERGARVEVRLLTPQPRRGSHAAAQPVLIDEPLFRADLFDQEDAPPGNLRSAHFHPRFEGVEPCLREWPDELRERPTEWLAGELGDLAHLVARAGVDPAGLASLESDAAELRRAVPAIVAAVKATWQDVRAGAGST